MTLRVWIDRDQRLLPAAAQWLSERFDDGGEAIDLSRIVCVLPGMRAGVLLLEALLDRAEAMPRSLMPPATITPGSLRERLLREAKPVASPREQVLAWLNVLRESQHEALAPILPHPPAGEGDFSAWLALAQTLHGLHEEVAGEMLDFEAIARCVEAFDAPGEVDRWAALVELARRYHARLHSAGLIDPNVDAAAAGPDRASRDLDAVVLIGVPELTNLHRRLLRDVAPDVTAIVHAPESLAAQFDEFGCPDVAAWAERALAIDDEAIILADRPRDQAQAALETIASLDGAFAAEDITIGLGDDSLAPSVEVAFDRAGVPAARRRLLKQATPLMLLSAVADWLAEPRFARFASLVRHADFERILLKRAPLPHTVGEHAVTDWLALLDRYFSEHLHERIDGHWLGPSKRREPMKALYHAASDLLAPLIGPRRAMSDWREPILSVMREIYGEIDTDTEDPHEQSIVDACTALSHECNGWAAVPRDLQPQVSAAEALRILVESIEERVSPADAKDGEIDVIDWPQLHLDPAAVKIVLGMNDGQVPQTVTNHPFLPNALRERAGLPHNDARLARDRYLLEAMLRSGDRVMLVCGRRDLLGEPLLPSRLLLSCDRESLPHRVSRLMHEDSVRRRALPLGMVEMKPSGLSRFVPPVPPPGPVDLQKMSVTQFRAYLECPYRFWLGHICRIDSIGDAAAELDPLGFGNLAHDVLHAFGEDKEIRESTDAEAIALWLRSELNSETKRRFGPEPAPAVRVQIARLRQRLEVFARRQAEHRCAGWKIARCEIDLPEHVRLDIPGEAPIRISGRIDRIDLRDDDGGVMLIDYKTGESCDRPEKAHGPNRDGEWSDLQLPLYHFAFRLCMAADLECAAAADIHLAYIALPKKAEDVDFLIAPWGGEELEEAIELARNIVRKIRAGEFEMSDVSSPWDPFATICQTGALVAREDEEEALA